MILDLYPPNETLAPNRHVGDYSRQVLGMYLKRPSRNGPQLNDLGKGASDTAT